MDVIKHSVHAPEGDELSAGGGDASPAPMPDDHADAGWDDTDGPDPGATPAISGDDPAADAEKGKPPATAEDAVVAALKKVTDGKDDSPKPPTVGADAVPDKPSAPASPDADKARAEALHTIPKGLKGEARAQFKALSDHAKSIEEQATTQRAEYDTMAERVGTFEHIIKDSGATPEVLSAHFRYIKACATGDLESALAFVEQERRTLATILGRPVDGVDLLADYPDLKQRVTNMELSEQDALELANSRRGQQRQHQHQAVQAQQVENQRAVRAQQQERTDALNGIQQWIAEQQGTMLPTDWQAIETAVVDYLKAPETQAILAKISPSLWLSHLKQQYTFIRKHAAQRPPPAGVTPLRPRGAGGAVDKVPGSAEEAVRARLGYQ